MWRENNPVVKQLPESHSKDGFINTLMKGFNCIQQSLGTAFSRVWELLYGGREVQEGACLLVAFTVCRPFI